MLKLQLTRANDYKSVILQLPSSPAEIGEVWAVLDSISDDVASTCIIGAISNVQNIGRYIITADINNAEQFKKLEKIAKLTDNLNREQSWLFEGALDSESVNGLDDVITIGERLEQYTLIPDVTTDHELGVYLVESGLKPFDESVRPYLNYSRIGIEYYCNHGGAYTTGGYVRSRDCNAPLVGTNRNISNLMRNMARTKQEAGLNEQVDQMLQRIITSGRYKEAPNILGDFVNITEAHQPDISESEADQLGMKME